MPASRPSSSADTGKLTAAAQRGLAAIWREGYRYKKAGVMLLDLSAAGVVQGGLFDAPDDSSSKACQLTEIRSGLIKDTYYLGDISAGRKKRVRCDLGGSKVVSFDAWHDEGHMTNDYIEVSLGSTSIPSRLLGPGYTWSSMVIKVMTVNEVNIQTCNFSKYKSSEIGCENRHIIRGNS